VLEALLNVTLIFALSELHFLPPLNVWLVSRYNTVGLNFAVTVPVFVAESVVWLELVELNTAPPVFVHLSNSYPRFAVAVREWVVSIPVLSVPAGLTVPSALLLRVSAETVISYLFSLYELVSVTPVDVVVKVMFAVVIVLPALYVVPFTLMVPPVTVHFSKEYPVFAEEFTVVPVET
jgi:hypothetical protein